MSLHRIAPEERLALGIKHWRTIVRVALLLTAFPLLIPRALFSPLGTGLDNSWKLALQMAYERGFVAGSEFIFTYGPLGFLANRLPFDSTKSLLVCFDLFVALNVAILLRRIYVGSQSVWSCFFCLLIFALLSVAMYYMEPSGALFGLTQFFLFDLLCSGWWWALPLAVLNLVLCLYVKVSMGLAGIGLFFLTILFLTWERRMKEALISLGILCIGVYVSTWFVAVDLLAYLTASLHLISGYNDAMYMTQEDKLYFLNLALVSIGLFLLVALIHVRTLITNSRALFLIIGVGLSLFLHFKSAFVRADEHVYQFFDFLPGSAGVLALFARAPLKRWACVYLVCVLGVSGYVARDRFGVNLWLEKYKHLTAYIRDMRTAPTLSGPPVNIPVNAQLSAKFLQTIGSSPVDGVPWDIAALFYNQLAYRPRPVIQSYAAFDSFLDGLNAQALTTERAPQFVILGYGCVDDRYCGFDDTETKLALYSNYQVVDRDNGMYLLGRREAPKLPVRRVLEERKGRMGRWIHVQPTEGLQLITFDIRYSPWGALRRSLFKPPPLLISFDVAGKKTQPFRAIVPLLRGGVMANRFVGSPEDQRLMLEGRTNELSEIRAFKLHSPYSSGFSPNFTMKIEVVQLENP